MIIPQETTDRFVQQKDGEKSNQTNNTFNSIKTNPKMIEKNIT